MTVVLIWLAIMLPIFWWGGFTMGVLHARTKHRNHAEPSSQQNTPGPHPTGAALSFARSRPHMRTRKEGSCVSTELDPCTPPDADATTAGSGPTGSRRRADSGP